MVDYMMVAREQARRRRERRRQREREREDEEGEGDDDFEDEEEDEIDTDDDDDAAEGAWRTQTERALQNEVIARWSASRSAIDVELAELRAQLRALQLMMSADANASRSSIVDAVAAAVAANAEQPRVLALMQAWRK